MEVPLKSRQAMTDLAQIVQIVRHGRLGHDSVDTGHSKSGKDRHTMATTTSSSMRVNPPKRRVFINSGSFPCLDALILFYGDGRQRAGQRTELVAFNGFRPRSAEQKARWFVSLEKPRCVGDFFLVGSNFQRERLWSDFCFDLVPLTRRAGHGEISVVISSVPYDEGDGLLVV